jgi:hypothetical protein
MEAKVGHFELKLDGGAIYRKWSVLLLILRVSSKENYFKQYPWPQKLPEEVKNSENKRIYRHTGDLPLHHALRSRSRCL